MKNPFSPHGTILTRFICGGLTLLSLASAQAAVITWGPASNIASDSDVLTTGSLVSAFNLGGSALTINGVNFASTTTGNTVFNQAGISKVLYSGAFYYSAPIAPASALGQLSSNYQSFLTTGGYADFSGGNTFTLSGLTPGSSYAFQLWSSDSRSQTAPGNTSTFTATNSIVLDHNISNADDGIGQWVVGTFVADGGTQSITNGKSASLLNAYQVRLVAVPEPSSFALLGFGAAVVAGMRRRSSGV